MDNGVAAEGHDDGGNTSLGGGHSCNNMMNFIPMLSGMVASNASLIIEVFFCNIPQQSLPKTLNLLVKCKLDNDNNSHM